MKIKAITLFALEVPFVEAFAHAAKTRRASDALIFKVEGDTHVGWGEALVRPYLSGETVDIVRAAFPAAARAVLGGDHSLEIRPMNGIRAFTGLRCGLELALLDMRLRAEGGALQSVLPPYKQEVIYSGVVSAEDPEKSLKIGRQLKQLGIRDFKQKVTPAMGIAPIRAMRALIGPEATLRLDANASFSLADAIGLCEELARENIAAIEEPLEHATPESLAALQRATSIPLMVDEALVTLDDADRLIAAGSAKMFNVRLAKCGGIEACRAIMRKAEAAGIGLQLGALVGETAILSTVGRALAASSSLFRFVEGSYGTLLLKEDIGRRSVRFGHGGKAPLLKGPGLGVEVDEAIVRKYAVAEDVIR